MTRLLDKARGEEGSPTANRPAASNGLKDIHPVTQPFQHLHGGVGVDKEYPLHRYFLYARHLELALGGGTQQLLKLGKLLASS